MFGNAIIADAGTHDLKGTHLLLDLFANPERAQEARDLLAKVSAEKDAAVAKLKEAQQALADAVAKEDALTTRQRGLDEREAGLKKREAESAAVKAEYEQRLQTMKDWLRKG